MVTHSGNLIEIEREVKHLLNLGTKSESLCRHVTLLPIPFPAITRQYALNCKDIEVIIHIGYTHFDGQKFTDAITRKLNSIFPFSVGVKVFRYGSGYTSDV